MAKKIFFFLSLVLCVLILNSCFYKFGGAEVYEATSETEKGRKLVKEYNIKYISPKVYSIYFADFYRKGGIFAYNVRVVKNRLKYTPLKTETAKKLKLKPEYSFWETYGTVFASILLIIFCCVWYKLNIE